MGIRFGSSRTKSSRDNQYKYPDNYQYNTHTNQQRTHSSHTNGYPYPNGYGTHLMHTNQYSINTNHHPYNTNSHKSIYIANYDFNGTSTSEELSFVKGDHLEILDRFT